MRRHQEIALQNEARVLELRAQGKTLEQIARDPTVGITTRSGVAKALRRGLERRATLGADELVALSLEQLDQVDAAVATVVTAPGVGVGDILRALDLRRKLIESRAKILGHSGSAAAGSGSSDNGATPDAGPGILTVMSLDDTPVEFLPTDLKPVGQVPRHASLVFLSPNWKPDAAYSFGEEGRLLRGNILFTASNLSPWLDWRQQS
ncbi:hypothetical protein [Kocuria rosea]|uniref:hypothetical protein n=1 Tax=Kocuria rosea TaxID=1275 RepID=UPI00203BFCF4|nr:hypothetical protein [Kocuria rosea]MCM3687693.1 hypothetical protein [Kocuria rosea]